MKTIWKYKLQIMGCQPVAMHKGAKILTVQKQRDIPCLWAEVETENPYTRRLIISIGTGGEGGNDLEYIGTCLFNNGHLVLHFYEKGEPK